MAADSDLPTRPVLEADRFGNLIRLRPEYRERYEALHRHPFPGLLERMRAAGQRNYSIFLREDLLFSCFEYVGSDFEADMEALADHDVVQDWWTLTDPMQEPLPSREEGEWWTSMTEVCHVGARREPASEATRRGFEASLQEGASIDGDVYDALHSELGDALEKANIQQFTVYALGSRKYTYLEHVGADVEADLDRLLRSSVLERLRSALPLGDGGAASPIGHPMSSVFFMA